MNFIDNWLQFFEVSYQKIIIIYKRKMGELFKTTPKSLPPKQPDKYKSNFQTTIRAVGEKLCIDNTNAKLSRIKRRQLKKKRNQRIQNQGKSNEVQ